MSRKPKRISSKDRREQILKVAMGLFARQGFQGATTRQIAARAGISEAIVFRHFPTKEDLYWAIILHKCREGRRRERLAEALQSGEESLSIFSSIAEIILRRNTEDATLSRLLLFSALENHRLSHQFFRTHVAKNYELLAAFIRRQIRAGRFRSVDPLLAARGFLGMVIYHFLIQELFGGKRYQKFSSKRVSRVLADIWLHGMQAGRAQRSRR